MGLWLAMAALSGCGEADDQKETPALSGIDQSFLDRTVDPCDDFYRFACGTWIDQHPTDDSPSVERFREGEMRNAYLLNTILEDDEAGTPYVPHPGTTLLGNYYSACMTERPLNRVGDRQLDARFQAIAAIGTTDDLARILASLHLDGVGALFGLDAEIDPGNPARRVATLYPYGLSLPDPSYYLDTTGSVLAQYQDHIRGLSALYPMALNIDPAAVVGVETALAQARLADGQAGDPIATYNLTSVGAVSTTLADFPFATYLTQLGFPSTLGEINVTEPGYLGPLDALLAQAGTATDPFGTIKDYLSWRVLEDFAETLGANFIVEEANFHSGVFYGDATPAPDWWACLGSTQWALGYALSQPFVSVLFDAEKKAQAEALLGGIKQAMSSHLASRSWLDQSTRAEAATKLSKVLDQVGFPDAWPGITSVPLSRTSYLGNVLGLVHAGWQSNIASLAQPVDRTTWSMPPSVTNAYYDPSRNQMVFPAAILQPPEFDADHPQAVNYGTIGTIMGHELTHGFDDYGRQFDGDGKLFDWWTPEVEAEFVSRGACLADQYSAYETVPGVRLDGELTLGENIADLGGVKLGLMAYRASGAHERFADSFTPDQEFFVAYAQLWCANFRDQELATLARTDPHSPPKFRVNGVVRNLLEFGEAFHCAAGSPMAPVDRCEVW
jgi:endothelin-converting enzyme/putative endopeptidase